MSVPSRPAPPSAPLIRVSRGTGTGPTRLAAFDAALVAAGVPGFNLLPLSSVIPTGSQVRVVEPADQLPGGHGDLLYCVYATAAALEPGAEAWAGVAWGVRDDGSGAGLFVEHHGPSEEALHGELDATLGAMMAARPGGYREAGRLVASVTAAEQPAVAVVLASYAALGWSA